MKKISSNKTKRRLIICWSKNRIQSKNQRVWWKYKKINKIIKDQRRKSRKVYYKILWITCLQPKKIVKVIKTKCDILTVYYNLSINLIIYQLSIRWKLSTNLWKVCILQEKWRISHVVENWIIGIYFGWSCFFKQIICWI